MPTLIFGGAFDPPHNEHIKALRCAVETTGAERAVILPTYYPPHKSAGFLDFATREELCRLAFSDVGCEVVVDDEEKRRGKDNFACILLAEMKRKYGDIIYLIGGDSLRDLDTWRNPEAIMKICPVAVAPRKGCGDAAAQRDAALKKYGGEIILLDFLGEDVSSEIPPRRGLRRRARKGGGIYNFSRFVPRARRRGGKTQRNGERGALRAFRSGGYACG